MSDQVSEFGYILLFISGGGIFTMICLLAGWLLRPQRPNYEKLTTYESGEEAEGNAWAMFNPRYYIIALIFVLFEVEIIFLFPWAIVFGNEKMIIGTGGLWGWFSFMEMFVFIGILALGLIYVWKNGFLDWQKPQVRTREVISKVPPQLYDQVNEKYSKISTKAGIKYK
jgi:NADH-quinone oxidoreductase subunit A